MSLFACTCDFPGTVREEMGRSDLVFVGKVVSKTWIESEDGSYFQIKIEVKEKFKGDFESKIVSLRTGPPAPACGFYFKVGKNYAIYTFSHGSEISTNQCTRTTKAWRKEKKK